MFYFHFKYNLFSREAAICSESTPTRPLLRPNEDICIGIHVLQRLFNMWHILNESVSMQQHFYQFVGNQRRLESL